MKKVLLSLGTAAFLFTGCGGDANKPATTDKAETPAVEETVSEKETPSETAEFAVELSSDDAMKYDKSEIRVPAGSTITLTLKHSGQLPLAAMGHNFVLLKKGVDMAEFANRAIAAGVDNNHIPEGDDVIAHTKLIGGGEETSVTFEAPEAGEYQFLCSFPGHYGMMNGKFIVE